MDACEVDTTVSDPNNSNGVNYKKKYEAFIKATGIAFPIIENKPESTYFKPSAFDNSKIMYFANKLGASSFASIKIDEYMERKKTEKAFTLHFVKPKLPESSYQYEKNLDNVKKRYSKHLSKFLKVMDVTITKEQLKEEVNKVVNLENEISKIIDKLPSK